MRVADNVQWPAHEMAVVGSVGPQSPLNRNLERLFEDAQISGELKISCRRLREFPKIASKYNLNDTVYGGESSITSNFSQSIFLVCSLDFSF
jgi:hypothetical protein